MGGDRDSISFLLEAPSTMPVLEWVLSTEINYMNGEEGKEGHRWTQAA